MPEELLPFDAEQYTKGRLLQADPDVVRALSSARAWVRRYCGWHVSPVRTETITLDGPGGQYLFLPTLKLVSLTAISEDGVALDLADVKASAEAPGVLAKAGSGHWGGEFGSVEVTLTHGFTADEAQDWREAVLALVDQASMSAGSGRSGPLISKRVDDVQYSWSGLPREVENAPLDQRALAPYRLMAI